MKLVMTEISQLISKSLDAQMTAKELKKAGIVVILRQ